MKILHLSNSDLEGGGSVVTYRLHEALIKKKINSKILVNSKISKNENIISQRSTLENCKNQIKNSLVFRLRKLLKVNHPGTISLNFFPSKILKYMDNVPSDIIHLHAINKEMISIKQISQIKKPLVWTFMDMWPLCGVEHYSETEEFIHGYSSHKKLDLNYWNWNKKKEFWKKKFKIICLSDWLTNCTKKSYLFKDFDIETIPPCIDTDQWNKIDKRTARELLDLDLNAKILLFSSANGAKDRRKGFNYILKILEDEYYKNNNFILLVIGELDRETKNKIPIKFKNFLLNTTDNEIIFRIIYSAADLFLIPSKLEALGQTAIESGSCSTPSIGFKNTGVTQVIDHKENGYLSNYCDVEDLNNGVKWCIKEIDEKNNLLGQNARKKILSHFSEEIITKKYEKVYNTLIKNK